MSNSETEMHIYGFEFLRQFVRFPKHVGAIAASSANLARAVTDAARVNEASVVVEFGPGTGVITEHILQRLSNGASFLAIEINKEFAEITRTRFPGAYVVHDSAVHARRYLEELGHSHCDCIVSGLPWAIFDSALQDALLDATLDALKPGGRFSGYMYLTSMLWPPGKRFREKLHKRFRNAGVKTIVWRNLPPAVVLYGEK